MHTNNKPELIPQGKRTEQNPKGLQYGDVVYVTGDKKNCTGAERWPNRPAIIVSPFINKRSTIEVIYLSHNIKPGRFNINITNEYGKINRACCDQIHCVDYSRIGSFLYHINEAELYSVRKAIAIYLNVLSVDDHEHDIKEWRHKHDVSSHCNVTELYPDNDIKISN